MARKNVVSLFLVALIVAVGGFGLGWFLRGTANSGQTVEQQTYAIMQQNIRNGMTIDQIGELLGDEMMERDYQIPKSIAGHYQRIFESRGSAIAPDDELCAIRVGDSTLVLHFREDRLINCRPDVDFGDPELTIDGAAG